MSPKPKPKYVHIWPKDPKPGNRTSWPRSWRVKDVLTGKGPDIYAERVNQRPHPRPRTIQPEVDYGREHGNSSFGGFEGFIGPGGISDIGNISNISGMGGGGGIGIGSIIKITREVEIDNRGEDEYRQVPRIVDDLEYDDVDDDGKEDNQDPDRDQKRGQTPKTPKMPKIVQVRVVTRVPKPQPEPYRRYPHTGYSLWKRDHLTTCDIPRCDECRRIRDQMKREARFSVLGARHPDERYDFRTRSYKVPDEGTWRRVEYCDNSEHIVPRAYWDSLGRQYPSGGWHDMIHGPHEDQYRGY